MIHRIAPSLTALACLALAGCTTTLAGSTPPDPKVGMPAGFAYQLPVLKYEVETTRLLEACPTDGEDLTFEGVVKASPTTLPGPIVILDHEALGDALKTTDATFTRHPNGMIKSVNVSVQDQTGEAVKGIAKAAIGIGKLSMGVAIPGVGTSSETGEVTKVYVVCTDLAVGRVATLTTTKKNLDTANETLADATQALSGFDADHALDNPRSETTNTERAKLAKAVRDAKKSQEDRTKEYAAAKAKLSVARRTAFIPKAPLTEVDALTASEGAFLSENLRLVLVRPGPFPKVYAKLRSDLTVDQTGVNEAFQEAFKDAFTTFLTNSSVQITTQAVTGDTTTGLNTQTRPCRSEKPERCGVVYYTAALGRLQVCQRAAAADCFKLAASDKRVLLREDRNIPQFGTKVSLSLRNGPYANNVLTASFTEDGQIEQASYKKQSAELVGAIGSLNEGVNAATELAIYRANTPVRLAQRQQARDAAELAALNGRTNLLTAQQLQDAKIAMAVDEVLYNQDLNAATRAIRLQEAIDKAIASGRTAADALTTSQLEQAQTDTTLLNALKTRLDAEKALQGPTELEKVQADTLMINALKARLEAERSLYKLQTSPP